MRGVENPGWALQSYCCTSRVGMAVTQGNDLGAFKSSKSSGHVNSRKKQYRSQIFSINQQFTLIIYIFI